MTQGLSFKAEEQWESEEDGSFYKIQLEADSEKIVKEVAILYLGKKDMEFLRDSLTLLLKHQPENYKKVFKQKQAVV